MAAIEWLMVGGPADGKKVTVLYGSTVKWADEDMECLYLGHNYLWRGRMYRIGTMRADDAEPSKVQRMIDETGLRPMDGY